MKRAIHIVLFTLLLSAPAYLQQSQSLRMLWEGGELQAPPPPAPPTAKAIFSRVYPRLTTPCSAHCSIQ